MSKFLIKSALLVREGGERRFDLLTSLGNVPVDDLIMAMESEDFRLLPFGLHHLVPHCCSDWEQSKDSLEVVMLRDGRLFSAMRKLGAATGIEAASMWIRGKIDAENAGTCCG
jgi:V/A-type H+-transporting ATPase subunit C